MKTSDIEKLEAYLTEKVEAFLANGGTLVSYTFIGRGNCCCPIGTQLGYHVDETYVKQTSDNSGLDISFQEMMSFAYGYDGSVYPPLPIDGMVVVEAFQLGQKFRETYPPINSYPR